MLKAKIFNKNHIPIYMFIKTVTNKAQYHQKMEHEAEPHLKSKAEESLTVFKRKFKFYKKRDCLLDLTDVIDPFKPSASTSARIVLTKINKKRIKDDNYISKIRGLRLMENWLLSTFIDKPGLYLIGGMLSQSEQLSWIDRSLYLFPEPPNITNLVFQKDNPYNGRNVFKTCGANKLRWVTMGNDYNWDTKEYATKARNELPAEMVKLTQFVVNFLGLGQFHPDAAIINYYPTKSYLSPHVDRSECDLSKPLISLSFGQPAIYLIGGTSLNDPVDALLLRSGDILVMSGEQRLVYHALPRILENTYSFNEISTQIDEKIEKDVLEYANKCRINITVRQIE